jgi:diguanylate cyclase (GGDEF)-like protein/PAS domain S-box-containing protein
MRVLYVEDNEFDADLAVRALRASAPAVEVRVVSSVGDAYKLLQPPSPMTADTRAAGPPFDVVLSDVRLPDGNGHDVLAHVRAAHLPIAVVVITGTGDETSVVTALRAGADDYIAKTGDYLQRLATTLSSAVEHFRTNRRRRDRVRRMLYAESSQTDADLARRCLMREMPEIRLDVVRTLGQLMELLPSSGPASGYDVIMLDYRPPMLNALDTLKELRQTRGIKTPVLIATGNGDEETALHALRLGATDYLVKGNQFLARLPVVIENALLHSDLESEQRALAESESRFRELAENLPAVFWMSDLGVRDNLYVSPAFRTLWGRDPGSLGKKRDGWLDAVHPEDQERLRTALARLREEGRYDEEYRVVRPDGSVRTVHDRAFLVRDADARPYRYAGIAEDVTWRKEQEGRIRHLAYHDVLTGLPNRALLSDRLAQALARGARHGDSVALLFLDIDRFKAINDSVGHSGGDELLRAIGERLRRALRDEDTVARVGGDEFIVVLPAVREPSEAGYVAEKIDAAMTQPFSAMGRTAHVSVSIGISLYPRDARDPDTLWKYAATAMRQAKQEGRHGYRFFSAEMDARVQLQLRIENDLRVAVEKGELAVHYQPQVSPVTGHITGVEALLRWQHSKEGWLPPATFIPVAEQSGLIVPIGEWVLETACRQAAAFHRAGHEHVRMCVNLSPWQLRRGDIVGVVRRTLAQTGLPASSLELEITESGVMEQAEHAGDILHALAALGTHIAIDDFGTGYSSLVHLKRFPIHRLKIDASFVQGAPTDHEDAVICQAVIALARELGLSVVGEGVETDAQRAFLAGHGCTEMQGFLFSQAVPGEDLLELLEACRVR